MPFPHLLAQAAELEKLRRLYESATPRQRFSVALDRINNPTAGANDLVTRVSAVEAIARSLHANFEAKSKAEVLANYRKVAMREATGLVEGCAKLYATTPEDLFGEELWETFRLAVSARNLLVHECTFIDAQKYLPMAHSCTEVLFGLVKLSKTRMPRSAT